MTAVRPLPNAETRAGSWSPIVGWLNHWQMCPRKRQGGGCLLWQIVYDRRQEREKSPFLEVQAIL